jgi:S1-C subfamily serine protease
MRWRDGLVLALLSLLTVRSSSAEQFPNLYHRVVMIKVGDRQGSAFTVERSDRQYLITARHMVRGLPAQNASIEISVHGAWKKFDGDVVLPREEDVDIAAFTLSQDLTHRIDMELGKSITLGESGFFFGYPHGWHTDFEGGYVAFVKRLSLSGLSHPVGHSPFWYLDGFNNPGFSGGPVAFYDYIKGHWAIVAVISGFQPEAAKKRVGAAYVDTETIVNSGVIVAYPIEPILDALDKYIAQKERK